MLPEALRCFVMDVAERQQSPTDFGAVSALCGIAAIVGNWVRIAPKQHDDWMVVPNLWGGIVGRPSTMKTAAMKSALAPVYALQDKLRRDWESDAKVKSIDGIMSGFSERDARKRAEEAFKDGDIVGARKILSMPGKSRKADCHAPG